MRFGLSRAFGMTALALAALLMNGCAGRLSSQGSRVPELSLYEDGLRVIGQGSVALDAEYARITMGVETTNEDAGLAVDENNIRTGELIDAMKRTGVVDDDIQTERFQIRPRFYEIQDESDPTRVERLRFVNVTNRVNVTVRDLEQTGRILQAAIDAGANEIQSVEFSATSLEAHHQQARERAIQDAQSRAAFLAKTAGVRLGKLRRIVDSSYPERLRPTVRKPQVRQVPRPIGSVPVRTRDLEINLTIELVYDIEPL